MTEVFGSNGLADEESTYFTQFHDLCEDAKRIHSYLLIVEEMKDLVKYQPLVIVYVIHHMSLFHIVSIVMNLDTLHIHF